MKVERISKRVRIPVETIPHLIGKHPKHERFTVSGLEHEQMQQQQTSDYSMNLCLESIDADDLLLASGFN